MRRTDAPPLPFAALAFAALAALGEASQGAGGAGPSAAPFLAAHCIECHSGADPEGDLGFEALLDGAKDLETWAAIRSQLRAGTMPPKKRPRPALDEVRGALASIDTLLAERDAQAAADPGRVTLRRLNRREYENTVRDLCGVDFDARAYLPADDVGYGFDTIGDVLSIPPALLEKYAAAAESIAARAFVVADPEHPPATRVATEAIAPSEGIDFRGGAWSLYRAGEIAADFDFPRPGEYLIRARAWAQQAGDEPARLVLRLDRREVVRLDVLATGEAPEVYEARVTAEAGRARVAAAFVNDYYEPENEDRAKRDRNLYVEWLEVAGPVGAYVPSDFQRLFLGPGEPRSVREAVTELALRAWRRPPTSSEVARLLDLTPSSAAPEERLRDALHALLVSPHFLFRVEADPPAAAAGRARGLTGYELASRLSYFVWSTLPDDALFAAAADGTLAERVGLEREVRRMLRDPRASALTEGFAPQWLGLTRLERSAPDATRFPAFDDELREAMRAETELSFEAVLREDRPVRDLIAPDFTFVNARLARHYGLAPVEGAQLRRVPLSGGEREVRGGLLQQASVLTATSNPTRTSPVKRGKWILDALLASPTPPPLPGADSLDESPEAQREASLRERLERHRADPACASCHDRMDGFGLALESYDPIGAWRESADGFAVDSRAELDDGTLVRGPADLERALALDPRFARALARSLAVYALGRGLRAGDEEALDAMVSALGGNDATLPQLIAGVVGLDAFRKRTVGEKP